jgi:hypothetical protein
VRPRFTTFVVMQTPLLSLGMLDLLVKDLRFSEPNRLSETLMVSLVIKHRLFQSFGAGSMTPATSPFALLNYQGSGTSSSSIIPFPYVTSGYVHPRLQDTVESGLGSTHFSPRNSLPIATRPFCNTVVSIVAHSQNFKVRALSVPAILHDRRSRNLGWSLSINSSNLLPFLPSLWITLS